MRKDMDKVLCERPRIKGGAPKGRMKGRHSLEDAPLVESMKLRYGNRKELNENLNPLRRWLRSKVGQPWDNVYSEACEVIDTNSTVRNHIKVHLLQMVEINTVMDTEGKIFYKANYIGRPNLLAIESLSNSFGGFYVHPTTKILCVVKNRERSNWRKKNADKIAAYFRKVAEGTYLLKLKGIWYLCACDSNTNKYGLHIERVSNPLSGGDLAVFSKRQLSSKELKSYQLINE